MSQWPVVPLEDLCEVNIGRTPSRKNPAFWSGSHPWASIRDLADGRLWNTREGITTDALKVMPPPAPEGTLLASFKLTIGRVAVTQRPMHHNEAIASFQNLDTDRIERDYLRHALPRIMANATSNNAVLGKVLNKAILKELPIPLPPLEEQRRIVALLDRAAAIRRRADEARSRARTLIPALFLKTFGNPATNPMGWEEVRFDEVTEGFRYGTNQKCHDDRSAADIPVLRIPNVIGGKIDWNGLKFAALTDAERVKAELRAGDLLFVRTNGNPDYIGRCAAFNGAQPASYASYLIRARLRPEVLPEFAVTCFNHDRYRPIMARAGRTTAGNYNLSTAGLGALPIMVPPLALQTAFAEQAGRIEAIATALDAAAARAETLAAALSARVFGAPAAPA